MHLKLVFILFVFTFGCSRNENLSCTYSEKITRENDSIHKVYHSGTIQFLNDYNEIDLQKLKYKSIRLIITKSLDDEDLIVFQMTHLKDSIEVRKRTVYTNECKKDKIEIAYCELNNWDKIQANFEKECFWNQRIWDNKRGLDGENYLLEFYNPETLNRFKSYFNLVRW